MEKRDKNILTKPLVICILALCCTLLWGSAYPCVKNGYRIFHIAGTDTGSQILFAGYRFTLAGVMTWLIAGLSARKIPLPKKEILGNVVILGLIQTTMQYVFFYLALANITGVKGAILSASNSFFSILLAHFFMKNEKMNLKKGIGCVLGFAGVVIINYTKGGFGGGFSITGEGFMLISCLAYGMAAVYVKTFAHKDNALTITAYQLLIGGVILIGIGLIQGGEVHGFTVTGTLLLLYMAFISSAAFSLWTLLLKYNPVGQVSIYGFTIPVFGILLSSVFLGERAFTLKNMGALLCVSLGIIVVNAQMTCKGRANRIQ
jgi:drug/metabolite transporter (DMT)-like permease